MFYKLMLLEVGQGYPQPWRGRRTSSISQKCCHPGSVHGRPFSLHLRAIRLDLHATMLALNLLIGNEGKQRVFRNSKLSSPSFPCLISGWAVFMSTGLRILSLLVGTTAFMERSSVSRQLEKPEGCFNSADVAAARGNRSSAVYLLIFILLC